MNSSELKYRVENAGHATHFFDRRTRNYGVRSSTITTPSGDTVECWELYRRHPVKHGLQDSAYFDKQTFERRFPAR